MHLGGWNVTLVNDAPLNHKSTQSDDGLFWFNINDYAHWKGQLFESKIGDVPLPNDFKNAIFDSGASHCYAPPADWDVMVQEIKKNAVCEHPESAKDSFMMCQCKDGVEKLTSKLPTIHLLMGSYFN